MLCTVACGASPAAKASVTFLLSSDIAGTVPYALKLPKGYSLTVVVNSVKRTYVSGTQVMV